MSQENTISENELLAPSPVEPVESAEDPTPIIKAKKPRSEAQKASLLKAQQTRKQNRLIKQKEEEKIKKEATKIVKKKVAAKEKALTKKKTKKHPK